MTNVNELIRIIDKYTITKVDPVTNQELKIRLLQPQEVYIDDIGVGWGVTDRLLELGYQVNGVSVGEKPYDPTK